MANQNSKSIIKPLVGIPWATITLVVLQVLVFLWEVRSSNVGLLGYVINDYDFNWAAFVVDPLTEFPTLISYTFFHANTSHLISNLLFFSLFSFSVEKRMGTFPYFAVYFLWGAVAALTQGFFTPFSNGLIGSSGAISGVAGAFFVLYPLKAPPDFLGNIIGNWIRKIPAFFWIGLWFLNQLREGFLTLLPEQLLQSISRIGYWAHIGGFIVGALSMFPLVFLGKANERE